MAKKIDVKLNTQSIDNAINELRSYKTKLPSKVTEICRRLAEIGAVKVSLGYARAIYNGDKDISVSVEPIQNGFSIRANGKDVLFVEFGAGVRYGSGHPQANEFGMGPGTYPEGKGHWNDPKGWWIPKANGGGHTYGNPPSEVMYRTAIELRSEVYKIAQEVFKAG